MAGPTPSYTTEMPRPCEQALFDHLYLCQWLEMVEDNSLKRAGVPNLGLRAYEGFAA